jgi:AbrB family looped-hinge helix DNA binding protein
MTVTIDGAGRLVIPRELREKAQLEAGVPLEIRFRDGRIEIEPTPRRVEIVRRGRLHVAAPAGDSAPLTERIVRATRNRVRERDR